MFLRLSVHVDFDFEWFWKKHGMTKKSLSQGLPNDEVGQVTEPVVPPASTTTRELAVTVATPASVQPAVLCLYI